MAYSVGIEEEHFIVERDSAALALNGPRSDAVYRISEDAGCSKHEQFLCQVELNTRRCDSVDEAIDCVRALRANANALLEREGFALLGAGVHPMGVEPRRKLRSAPDNGHPDTDWASGPLALAALTCGIHLHVGLDREQALRAERRIGAVSALLGAAACASPWFEGARSPYLSSRQMLRRMMPNSGIAPDCADIEEREQLAALIQRMDRRAHTAWRYDARASRRWPTLELRCADQMASIENVRAWANTATALALALAGKADPGVQFAPAALADAWRTKCARDGCGARLVMPRGHEEIAGNALRRALSTAADALRGVPERALARDAEAQLEGLCRLSGEGRQPEWKNPSPHKVCLARIERTAE